MIRPGPFEPCSSISSRSAPATRTVCLTALILPLAVAPTLFAVPPDSPAIPSAQSASNSGANPVSVAEYQTRLQSLDQLIVACQRSMNPANCQRDRVGPDLQLTLPSGSRQIRFAWLRELLDRAATDQGLRQQTAGSDDKQGSATPKSPAQKQEFAAPALAQQLEDARKRLAEDATLAGAASTNSSSNLAANPATQRQILTRILAAPEYHPAVARPSLWGSLLEKLGKWIDWVITRLQQVGFQSRWIGITAEIGFIALICAALVWLLIRLERQGRLSATTIHPPLAAGAASARDWQLWLQDARKASAQGAWRDAIHLTYWACISRIESSGQWPADRARTPREYLALLSPQSAQRSNLTTLTRSFERTWYAGRLAVEADFRKAEQIAAELGVRSINAREAQ